MLALFILTWVNIPEKKQGHLYFFSLTDCKIWQL
jgi:hypothetical protein